MGIIKRTKKKIPAASSATPRSFLYAHLMGILAALHFVDFFLHHLFILKEEVRM